MAMDKKAWIVFTNQTDLPLLSFLKDGFRHCFVVLHEGDRWISIDPMAHHMVIDVHDMPESFDMPAYLHQQGYQVIEAVLRSPPLRPAPWMFFTCVEVCKRMLGIHKFAIFTPWQLYRYLKKHNLSRS